MWAKEVDLNEAISSIDGFDSIGEVIDNLMAYLKFLFAMFLLVMALCFVCFFFTAYKFIFYFLKKFFYYFSNKFGKRGAPFRKLGEQ